MAVPFYPDVQVNAWTGTGTLRGPGVGEYSAWGLHLRAAPPPRDQRLLRPKPLPDERCWRHPEVGWGLVVTDCANIPEADRAAGVDLPASLRRLMAARPGSPILRYVPGGMNGYLRRYFTDGRPAEDLGTAGSAIGLGDGQVPKYLLICGSPDQIPWRQQYVLNMSHCVGRLDLPEDRLANYVEHLLNDWADAPCAPAAPVVWSVNLGQGDITWLMQTLIADGFWDKMSPDPDFKRAVRLKDAAATGGALADALARRPGLIVTTSHGMTGSSNGGPLPAGQLGVLVDANNALLMPDILPEACLPGGAIWYAHACCSAGSDAHSQFADLFPVGHDVGDTLRAVARDAGSVTSPLVSRLLSAATPVRAFVGHVEPAFDWTLRDPFTNQALADVFTATLWNRLYQPGMPIGLALSEIFAQAGAFLTMWKSAVTEVARNTPGALHVAIYRQVAALDRQSIVILGDPTVSLPL